MLTRVMHRTARAVAPALAAAFLSLRALAGGPTDVAHLAPERSFLVINIPSFAQLQSTFDKSELGALWKEPGVKGFVEKVTEEEAKSFAEFFKKINAESKDLKPPTGAAGLALFIEEDAEGKARKPSRGEDGETQPPPPGMLVVADMGENADAWQEIVDKVLDRAQKDKQITTEEDKYGDAKLTVIKPVKQEPKKRDGDGEEMGDDEIDKPAPSGLGALLGGPFDDKRELFLARAGTTMALCSDRKVLEAALDTLGGKEQPSAADRAEFRDALAQHPGNELAYAVLSPEPLLKVMSEQAAENGEVTSAQMSAMMGAIGASDIKAVSLGLHMDTPDAVTELSVGILAPQKKGLLNLVSDSGGAFEPPAFVPADAASASRFSFRFSGLLDLAREAVGTFPEQQRAALSSQLDQVVNIAKPALDALGPTVWVVNTLKQPLAADSQMSLIAIDVKDTVAVSNTITFLVGQMGGILEPRDFEGNTIFAAKDESAGIPFALGLGFNRLFIGNPAAIENAMRLAGRTDAPRLATDGSFKDATRPLGNDAVVYSFSDLAQDLRWTYWQMQNAEKIYESMLDRGGAELEPEVKAQIMKDYRERHKNAWADALPPMETVLSHLGDTVTELRATPDGFRGRVLMLKPTEKK